MASNEITDDSIAEFLTFSGSADPAVARQYLEMSGNDLSTAVSLFMDHGAGGMGAGGAGGAGGSAMGGGGMGGGGGGMTDAEPRAPDATRSMRLLGGDSPHSRMGGGMGGGMGGMGGGMGGMGGDPNAALMAAMGGPAAREMMRNMMAAENGGGGADGMLMGGMASSWAAADGANASAARDAGDRRGRNRSGSSGGGGGGSGGGNARRNNQRNNNDSDDNEEVQAVDADGEAMDEDDDYNYYSDEDADDSHDLGGTSNNNARANNATATQPPSLSTMFAQPTHLMHRAGGFMGAKNFAKDARRWLLVNIQSDDDFACHALNRDVWRDELVENLVREGFILWQAMSNSNEGQTYITRYKVTGYPHLAIIDPRTGSLLWRKEGWTQVKPLTAEQFVEIASDFCSRHSFDKLPMAARHAYTNGMPLGAAATASSSNESSSRPAANGNNKRPIHELTEEEQLQAAIRASMQGGDNEDVGVDEKPSAAAAANSNDNATSDEMNANGNDDESKPSAFEQEILSMEVGDEPTPGQNVARVQIRMPDGKRLVRKFGGESPVKIIYAFVAQQQQSNNEEAESVKAFELKAKFPPQDLFASIDDSISSCGLNGEAINVIWK